MRSAALLDTRQAQSTRKTSFEHAMTGVASSSRFAILRTSLEVELDEELGTISCPDGADVAPETLHLWIAFGRRNVSA